MAIGGKTYPRSSIFAFFKVFRLSALFEKLSCCCALHRESTKVTSHTSGFPRCQGLDVTPSCRLPSDLDNPAGSKTEGITTEPKDRLIKSLKKHVEQTVPRSSCKRAHEYRTHWHFGHSNLYVLRKLWHPVAKPRRNEVGRR